MIIELLSLSRRGRRTQLFALGGCFYILRGLSPRDLLTRVFSGLSTSAVSGLARGAIVGVFEEAFGIEPWIPSGVFAANGISVRLLTLARSEN